MTFHHFLHKLLYWPKLQVSKVDTHSNKRFDVQHWVVDNCNVFFSFPKSITQEKPIPSIILKISGLNLPKKWCLGAFFLVNVVELVELKVHLLPHQVVAQLAISHQHQLPMVVDAPGRFTTRWWNTTGGMAQKLRCLKPKIRLNS